MSWRLFQRFRLGGGVNASLSQSGIGWSWGIPGIRIGISGAGRKWISFGIPGTGLYFYKTIGFKLRNERRENTTAECSADDTRRENELDSELNKAREDSLPPGRWRNVK